MQLVHGVLTLTGVGQQLPISALRTNTAPNGFGLGTAGTQLAASKITVQLGPAATGLCKIQGDTSAYSGTTGGGIFLSPNTVAGDPGGSATWDIELDRNEIALEQYFFSGSNPGDLLFYEIGVN
jgi:hypothetical protein